MTKASTLLAALLFASASAAFAAEATDKTAPTKPTTGQGAATTVSTNPALTESGGKAAKGLDTATDNIDKPKKHSGKHEGTERRAERAEKAERPARAERPEMPERPSR